MEKYFVTAIGTDSGKTLASAILVEALNADYWKPVQSGEIKDEDTIKIYFKEKVQIHESSYFFKMPASPHQAAQNENIEIQLEKIQLPNTKNNLVIEGAGGVLVPLNDRDFVIDIAQKFDCKVILVSNYYLGSINHSLLSIRELQRRNLNVLGIIFNGQKNEASKNIILKQANLPCLLEIEQENFLDKNVIQKYADVLKSKL